MKSIEKHLKRQIQSNKRSAGGDTMRTFAVSDPRFSRVKSDAMFAKKEECDDDIEEAKEKEKETENPSKSVKRLKKMKGAEGKKGKK